MKTVFVELPISTRDGEFLAHYSEKGLAGLDFPKAKKSAAPNHAVGGRAVNSKQIPLPVLQWHRTTTDALKKILGGTEPKELPPLDWTGKTEFQKSVWKAMLQIPPGRDQKLRRSGRSNRQTQGRSRRRRSVRGESDSSFGSVPSRSGRQQQNWRFFQWPGLEMHFARTGGGSVLTGTGRWQPSNPCPVKLN